jgi:hypothetical protein
MLGLTRALAVELAPTIQVNAVLPGWFETELTRDTRASPRGDEIRRRTPAGRWGEPADLVGPTIFLASPASDFSPALRCRSTAATRSPSDSSTTKDRGDEPPSAAPPTLSEGAGRGTALRRGSCRGR